MQAESLAQSLGVASAWISMLEATSEAIQSHTPLARLALEALCSQSASLVWLSFLLNHVINADILSVIFPLTMFFYGVLEANPSRKFFSYLVGYTLIILWAKLLYQLPIFCGTPALSFITPQPDVDSNTNVAVCVAPEVATAEFMDSIPTRIDRVIGLRKYTGHSSIPRDQGFWLGALPDIIVLLTLLFHREMLLAKGDGIADDDDEVSMGVPAFGDTAVGTEAGAPKAPTSSKPVSPSDSLGEASIPNTPLRRIAALAHQDERTAEAVARGEADGGMRRVVGPSPPPSPPLQEEGASVEGASVEGGMRHANRPPQLVVQGSSRLGSDGVLVHEGEDHGELSAGQEEEAAAANADGDGADGDNDDNGDDSDKQEEGEEGDEGEAERESTDSESDDDCTELCGVACQTGAQNSGRYLQRKATGAWVSARDTWLQFWDRLVPPTPKRGEDLYMLSGMYALAAMIYAIIFFGFIGRGGLALSSSQLNPVIFLSVMMGVLVLVADRLIYKLWRPYRTYSALNLDLSVDDADQPGMSPVADEKALGGTSPSGGNVPLAHAALIRAADAMPDLENRAASRQRSRREEAAGAGGGESKAWCGPRVEGLIATKISPALKLLMHFILVIILHSTIYFLVPLWTCDAASGKCADGSADCCEASAGVSIFYLICARYLFLSARQLRVGLPLILRDRPLTDGGTGTAMMTWIKLFIFKQALNVPFLWEVQQVMDWTVEVTSLDLKSYMNVEDIYVGLCLVRANLYWRRYLKGKKHPWYNKLSQGATFVAVLIIVLVGPLYLFSSVNPIADPNLVQRSSVSYRLTAAPRATPPPSAAATSWSPFTTSSSPAGSPLLSPPSPPEFEGGGSFPLGEMSRYRLTAADIEKLSSTPFNMFKCKAAKLDMDRRGPANASAAEIAQWCGYNYLIAGFSSYSADFQVVKFSSSSDGVWGVSSDALDRLRAQLPVLPNASNATLLDDFLSLPPPSPPPSIVCSTLPPLPLPGEPMQLEIEMSFRRALVLDGPGSDAISLTCARPLAESEERMLAAHLDGLTPSMDLDGAFPKFLRLPSTRNAEAISLAGTSHLWHTLQNLSFSLRTVEGQGDRSDVNGHEQWWQIHQRQDDYTQFAASRSDGLQVIVAAERLAGGTAASSLTGGGVLVFYVVVVYAIGRMVRSALGNTRYKIMLDELPDVKDIVEIIEAMHLARKSGQLQRETELHEMLLRLYRSPAVLLQITGERLKEMRKPNERPQARRR